MSESTEVRILYDQTTLYIGVRCSDRNPDGIIARGRERDGSVLVGDHVAFFFDTFHDRRNGYVFAVSPDEGRWDALVSNHFAANTDWDGIWDVRCRKDAGGWTAEIVIPFKTLAYEPKGEVWGFNFSRNIARKGESGRWTSPRPETKLHYAGNAGTLTGLQGLPVNLGVEVSPYVLARSRDESGKDASLGGDAGLDVRWRINPGLTATLSLNTDFADTEVDQRQINFTRFPLFFPEKRDFFLEDSGIYRFADLNQRLLIPYFTRRIGLSGTGDRIKIELQAAEISAGFDPALGFIRRSDVRYYASNSQYLIRPASPTWYQWFSFIYANQIYTDLDNDLQTRSHSFYLWRCGSREMTRSASASPTPSTNRNIRSPCPAASPFRRGATKCSPTS